MADGSMVGAMRRLLNWAIAVACAALWTAATPVGQTRSGLLQVTATGTDEVRAWDTRIDAMLRAGDLELTRERPDDELPGRTHQRLQQVHRGVKVFGAEVTRQLDRGATVSSLGTLYTDIDIATVPTLSVDDAARRIERLAGVALTARELPELTILPRAEGGYRLTYRARVVALPHVTVYFIDAHSGAVVLEYSDLKSQSAVGVSRGILNDVKKISVESRAGRFLAIDRLRPTGRPANTVFNGITTFDMGGDPTAIALIIRGLISGESRIASDSDNEWTDPAVADAHPYSGWVTDYLFKRFGRRGLDDDFIELWNFVNPVRLEDFRLDLPSALFVYYCNASYVGFGNMIYGVGLPDPFRLVGGRRCISLAGALDVVAHELAHGITEFTSDLIYMNEPGALNEAFSDIIGASVERFFHPAGDGLHRADWLLGEDVITGGLRSMANPMLFGDPDHYSIRFTGTADNGGVHINSGIPNHAFYLAVVGGRHRLSGLDVQGVGLANHEQMERVFWRAFTQLMPANSTFFIARLATIVAARDLYGVNSAAERAVTQAWTAVGVQ
jgi:bacillolysin